jgi:histidyl-tRNA synthetase
VAKVATSAPVFLAYFDRSRLHDYLRLAAQVRAAGIGVEFYCEPKKLGTQLKYADERGFRLALVLGEDEFAAGQCQLKDLATGKKTLIPINDGPAALIAEIQTHLGVQEVGRGQPR